MITRPNFLVQNHKFSHYSQNISSPKYELMFFAFLQYHRTIKNRFFDSFSQLNKRTNAKFMKPKLINLNPMFQRLKNLIERVLSYKSQMYVISSPYYIPMNLKPLNLKFISSKFTKSKKKTPKSINQKPTIFGSLKP